MEKPLWNYFFSVHAFEFTSQCYEKWQRRDLIKPLQKKEKSNKILQISKGEDFDCVNLTRWKATFTWIFESLNHRFNSPRENKTPIIRLINLMDGSTSPEIASPSMRLINPIYFRSLSVTNPISNNITPFNDKRMHSYGIR